MPMTNTEIGIPTPLPTKNMISIISTIRSRVHQGSLMSIMTLRWVRSQTLNILEMAITVIRLHTRIFRLANTITTIITWPCRVASGHLTSQSLGLWSNPSLPPDAILILNLTGQWTPTRHPNPNTHYRAAKPRWGHCARKASDHQLKSLLQPNVKLARILKLTAKRWHAAMTLSKSSLMHLIFQVLMRKSIVLSNSQKVLPKIIS